MCSSCTMCGSTVLVLASYPGTGAWVRGYTCTCTCACACACLYISNYMYMHSTSRDIYTSVPQISPAGYMFTQLSSSGRGVSMLTNSLQPFSLSCELTNVHVHVYIHVHVISTCMLYILYMYMYNIIYITQSDVCSCIHVQGVHTCRICVYTLYIIIVT